MISIARRSRSHSYGPQLNLPELGGQKKSKNPNIFGRKSFSRFARNLETTFNTNMFKPKKDFSKAERFFMKKKKEKTDILDHKFGSKEFFEEARRLERLQKMFGTREIVDYRHDTRSIYPEEQEQRRLNSSPSSNSIDDQGSKASNRKKAGSNHIEFLDKRNNNQYQNLNKCFTSKFNQDYFKSVQEKMRLDYLRKKAEMEMEKEQRQKAKGKGRRRSKTGFIRRIRVPSIRVLEAPNTLNNPKTGQGVFKSDKHIRIKRGAAAGGAYSLNPRFHKSSDNIPDLSQTESKRGMRRRSAAKRKKFSRQDLKNRSNNKFRQRTLSSPFVDLIRLNESSKTFDLVNELQNFLKEEEENQLRKKEEEEGRREAEHEDGQSSVSRTFIFKVKKRRKRRGNMIRRER